VKNIVMLTRRSESDDTLIRLLNAVFPDCEICVVCRSHAAPKEVNPGFLQGNGGLERRRNENNPKS